MKIFGIGLFENVNIHKDIKLSGKALGAIDIENLSI